MKKLALLLAAMTAVSAVASAKEVVAAPIVKPEVAVVCPETVAQEGLLVTQYIEHGLSDNEDADTEYAIYARSKSAYKGFRATSFGMEVEWEKENSNFNALAAVASVGMAYGTDWQFGVTGVKFYGLPRTNDNFALRSSAARAEVWARKNNRLANGGRLDIGLRARTQNTHDRWALRLHQYSVPLGFTTLSGWGLVEYRAMNAAGGADNVRFEVMPLNFTVGPVRAGYYFYGGTGMGSNKYEEARHQARVYLPGYNAGKFSSNLEFRYEFKRDSKDGTGADVYGFDARNSDGNFGGYINAAYKVNPQLNVYSYLGVFANQWEFNKNADPTTSAGRKQLAHEGKTSYYTDFGVGFSYAF